MMFSIQHEQATQTAYLTSVLNIGGENLATFSFHKADAMTFVDDHAAKTFYHDETNAVPNYAFVAEH